jgi:hypothetical protein
MKQRRPQIAERKLIYFLPSGNSYCDVFRDLSAINRKLFRQGHSLVIERAEFISNYDPALVDSVVVRAFTAGETWPVHNAHVKAKAMWDEMNELVLEDNPSVKGKWHDFKVYLDDHMHAGVINAPYSASGAVGLGEWDYLKFVMPEHDVNPGTGEPVPADETFAHLVGPDVGVIGAYDSVGLVKAYGLSRATVQDVDPNVPAAFGTSFFNLLTDSGSQEPELANVIEDANDQPPYDVDAYPGGATNCPGVISYAEIGASTIGSPLGMLSPFVAQCGLIKFDVSAYKNGLEIPFPESTPGTPGLLGIVLTVAAGKYKGVAAIPMGQ